MKTTLKMLSEQVTEQEQDRSKELAIKIGAMLGDGKETVMVNAMALALATAELIDFVEPEFRQVISEFIFNLTKRAVRFLAEQNDKTPQSLN